MAKLKSAVVPDDREWQAEDDLRTLVRAAEIKKDKARAARALALAKKQMAELKKVSSA